MQVGGRYPDLSEAEWRLVQVVASGELLDLAGKKHADADLVPAKAMRQWGRPHVIRASVIRDIMLGRLVPRPDPRGIRLRGARISGRLELEYVTAAIPLSLTNCYVPDRIVARGATLPALVLRGCVLAHPDQPPLAADRLTTTVLDLSLATVTASCERAGVFLAGADIGLLDVSGAQLANERGPALDAEECHVRREVRISRQDRGFATRRFEARGRSEEGAAITLRGATIDGALHCSGFVSNQSGPALDLSDLTVGQSVLAVRLTAEGDGSGGAVRLRSARIGGSLSLSHAQITNDTGPAVTADGVDIGEDVFFSDGFTASGNGGLGVIRLPGAHIGGQLVCADAIISSASGSALYTDGLVIEQDFFLVRITATGGSAAAVLDIASTSVGRGFSYRPTAVTNIASRNSLVNVDGLTYQALPIAPTPPEWLRVIGHETPSYAAQPYRHLAAALSAVGNDKSASEVLIAQRRDQLDRNALTGAGPRAWARFTGAILGYGYRPSRALLFLLGVFVASIVLATLLGAHGALAQPPPAGSARPAAPCTTIQRVAVGLDLGEPFVSPAAQCGTTLTTTGNTLTVLRWILQIAAWALATLFVAGFTSAVRKT